MENRLDSTENTEKIRTTAATDDTIDEKEVTRVDILPKTTPPFSQEDNNSIEKAEVKETGYDSRFMVAPDLDDLSDTPANTLAELSATDNASPVSAVEEGASTVADDEIDNISAPGASKSVIDDETVEQLVENRLPEKEETVEEKSVQKKKKKKKHKKNYALRTLIVILAFILVFAISFFLAFMMFSSEDTETSTETTKADDMSEKLEEESDEDKSFIPENNDIAYPIDPDYEVDDEPAGEGNSNGTPDENNDNDSTSTTPSGSNTENDNSDDVHQGTVDNENGNTPEPSDNSDDSSSGSAGIVLD